MNPYTVIGFYIYSNINIGNSNPGLQRPQLEDVHQYGFGDNETTASKESSDSDDNIAISLEMRKKSEFLKQSIYLEFLKSKIKLFSSS